MARTVTLTLQRCAGCPYVALPSRNLARPQCLYNPLVLHKAEWVFLDNVNTIPDWCPLEKVVESL